MKFSILRISSVNGLNPQENADLVTFTEEMLNGKIFSCSELHLFKGYIYERFSLISYLHLLK